MEKRADGYHQFLVCGHKPFISPVSCENTPAPCFVCFAYLPAQIQGSILMVLALVMINK